jgi:catechol 2,3-dioxygenase-like lactoylglutathione lyase family enzyme
MTKDSNTDANVKEVVPFLHVSDIERSVRYYVGGLGFTIKNKWVVDGKLRWCWLSLGGGRDAAGIPQRRPRFVGARRQGWRRRVALFYMRGCIDYLRSSQVSRD